MKQLSVSFSGISDLVAFLQARDTAVAIAHAHSILAQVYTGICDHAWIAQVVAKLDETSDKIVTAGATTFGEIDRGCALSKSSVVSLTCFDTATLVPVHLPCSAGQETAAVTQMVQRFADIADPIQGVLLLATTLSIDCGTLLDRLHGAAPDIPVFGGGSGDNGWHRETFVFSSAGIVPSGIVAVALCGPTLQLLHRSYLGWQRMGRPMTVTRASRFTLHTINDRPAFEIYRRYLGIEADDNFFFNAMEFPFLVERNGALVARVANAVDADGAIHFVADLEEGETIEFGYAHVETLTANVTSTLEAIQTFEPEAISLFACGCRHFVMQDDASLELAPFQAIAPTSGFYTYGEFCSFDSHSTLLNSALVVVGMRESEKELTWPGTNSTDNRREDETAVDIYAHNHMRVLSRFQRFMQAVTEDLEQANRTLALLADHDYLTGLCNRRLLESRVAQEIERSRRYSRDFCVIFADIDHFKILNDTFGHSAGDQVLKDIGGLLTDNARTSDLVCRYGGEEFVLLLPETRVATAISAVQKLRGRLEELVLEYDSQPLPAVTLSFGIASFPRDGNSCQELVMAADRALYAAKRSGRDRVNLAAQPHHENISVP